MVALLLGALALVPAVIRRSRRHPAPALDLDVFRSRTVTVANVATFLYAVGFFAMLLANVLFLTSVWGYSTLAAGLAITPGPLVVALLSGPSGRMAARIGYGPVLVAGGIAFAVGLGSYLALVGTDADYLSHRLPGSLLVGLGSPSPSRCSVPPPSPTSPRSGSASAARSTRPPARSVPSSASRCSSPCSAPPPPSSRRSTASGRHGPW